MQDFEIRFSGSGGQGLILVARILSTVLTQQGFKIAQSQSYEPTSRGGLSRSDMVVSENTVDYPLVTALDYLLILDQVAVASSDGMIKPGAVIISNSDQVTAPPVGDYCLHNLPLSATARHLGSPRVTNVVALGVLIGLSDFTTQAAVEEAIRSTTPSSFLELNLDAVRAGCKLVEGQ